MSNSTIITKSNANEKKGTIDRSIELEKPEILQAASIEEVVSILGADHALSVIQAQLTVGFRSHVRTKLESNTDGEPTYTDEDLTSMDFSDWKPEPRTRKTAEEKAIALLGTMSADQVKAILAGLEG
jgi:hypothetical protein